jgi:hypothetical protein
MNPLPVPTSSAQAGLSSRERVLRDLLDLAYDVSARLRHHRDRVVRVSAALLLAASLAACSGAPAQSPPQPVVTQTAPLAREVRTGLPTSPGRYTMVKDSLFRDSQGVYQFGWIAQDGASGTARISSLKLAQAEKEELEVPESGDPTLSIAKETPIRIIESSTAAAPAQNQGGGGGGIMFLPAFWYPFGGGFFGGPGYYDPPRTVASGSTVEGGTRTTTPKPLTERSIGLDRAVSGRAGGTGAGTAATSKSGATVGGKSGAADAVGAAPKSGGFSAGKPSIGSPSLSGG